MRFFKYLVFAILSFSSINAFAAIEYSVDEYTWYSSPDAACKGTFGKDAVANTSTKLCTKDGETITRYVQRGVETKCPAAGYPVFTYFANNTPAPTQVCKQNPDGTFCVYNYGGTSSPKNPLIISANNNRQQIILNSVSEIPSPSCTPQFHKTSCDPNDPYAGCYKPPNDDCNRMSDGSIYCPSDVPPPDVSDSCNGATYCKRPPQGCGEGYVSGSFNDKQLCVKTSPSTGSGSGTGGENGEGGEGAGSSSGTGEGTGTSTSTGSQSTTTTTTNSDGSTSTSTSTTTTNNTTVNNFKIDLSGVISAVKEVSSKITNLKNELLTSITNLTNKVDQTNIKLDSTNLKLDTSNNHLSSIKDSNLRQEQLLKDIRDKTVTGEGSPSSSADLTETNKLLKEIRDFWKEEPNAPEGDVIPTGELTERSFLRNLITVNASYCPADKQINWSTPFGHLNKTVSYRSICDSSSWLGYLFLAAAYVYGAMIVVRDS